MANMKNIDVDLNHPHRSTIRLLQIEIEKREGQVRYWRSPYGTKQEMVDYELNLIKGLERAIEFLIFDIENK